MVIPCTCDVVCGICTRCCAQKHKLYTGTHTNAFNAAHIATQTFSNEKRIHGQPHPLHTLSTLSTYSACGEQVHAYTYAYVPSGHACTLSTRITDMILFPCTSYLQCRAHVAYQVQQHSHHTHANQFTDTHIKEHTACTPYTSRCTYTTHSLESTTHRINAHKSTNIRKKC
jgi:hypothetical protein